MKKLNSQARQASAERAWQSIKRFYDNYQNLAIKKKGFPKFKKARSVEYKTTGYKLSKDRKSITFTDGFKAGSFRLVGAWDLNYYQPEQIKRVRVVRRVDGYYAVKACLISLVVELGNPLCTACGQSREDVRSQIFIVFCVSINVKLL